jgi:NitT/TauT family transport system permease protein
MIRRLARAWIAWLWGGWSAAAGLVLLLAAWQIAAEALGPLLLPAPLDVFARLLDLAGSGALWPEFVATARRALLGFALALAAGGALGVCAGLSPAGALLARPLVTVLLGMPPIAWLVLALLWLGSGDGTPVFTVAAAALPVVFGAALQGMRTLDAPLAQMARAFGLPLHLRVREVVLPHLLSWVFPAAITALGTSWKVAVMAELLASSDGIGAALAGARSQLDTEAALAWVACVLLALLVLEYGLLEPVRRELERWREASR